MKHLILMPSGLVSSLLFSPVKQLTNSLPSSQPRLHLGQGEAVVGLSVLGMKFLPGGINFWLLNGMMDAAEDYYSHDFVIYKEGELDIEQELLIES